MTKKKLVLSIVTIIIGLILLAAVFWGILIIIFYAISGITGSTLDPVTIKLLLFVAILLDVKVCLSVWSEYRKENK